MKLDPERKARQDLLITTWRDRKAVGTLQCATGFGKTVTALLGIVRFRKHFSGSIMVVVPTVFLRDQWGEKIREWEINNIEVWVINSVVKRWSETRQKFDCQLLILDEIHVYTAETFSKVFDCVSYEFVLGLTATLRDDDEKNAVIRQYCPVVDTVTLSECLVHGWVSPFTVYNLGIKLSESEEKEYKALNAEFSKWFAIFGQDFDLAMGCLKHSHIRENYARTTNWTAQALRVYALNWNKCMQRRKEFLYNLESKVEVAKEIVEQFPDKLIITFSQTIEMADKLTEILGDIAVSYHSQVTGGISAGKLLGKSAMLEHTIDMFADQKKEIRVLNTANALDQGADIPDIDMMIVLSGSSKPLQALQRYGRGIRFQEGKHTIIVELYVKGSQDAKWLKDRQRKIPRGSIKWIDTIDEIELTPSD
jgi:superfamily II DNA or RNA helicase